ncbi:MAG TPA: hypothetical protein VJ813_03050 [Vicinamibacterales bacterium]|nr:hypothetical protein [Vicinamibacterales bacterium]
MFVMLLASLGVANGQSFGVHGSAGPTLRDRGYSIAAGIDFSPISHVALVFNVERTHIASRVSRDRDSISTFRGATVTLGTAELRVTPLGRHRVGPYGLIGTGAGVARPNEDERFPGEGTTGSVRTVFFGGGFQVPVRQRLNVFAEFRMMLVGEVEGEGLLGVGPLRAGLAWRF